MSAQCTPSPPNRPVRATRPHSLSVEQRASVLALLKPLPPNAKTFHGLARYEYDRYYVDKQAEPDWWIKRLQHYNFELVPPLNTPQDAANMRAVREYICRGLEDAVNRLIDPRYKEAKALIRKVRRKGRRAA